MTKEEILAMKAGRELNIRIAEDVMGYKFIEDEIFGDMEGYGNSLYNPLRAYSEDISVAEHVIDKLKDYNPKVEFNHYTEKWEADFGYGIVSTTNAPETICKAALLAMVETKGGEESAHR